MGKKIFVGYGKSINPDVEKATKEAIQQARGQLGNKTPQYAFLFTTVDYDSDLLIQHLSRELGPSVKISGLSSCGGVMTKDGFHKGEKGSLALMLFNSPKISFGVSYSSYTSLKEADQSGITAIKQAIVDAGKKQGEIPQLILVNADPGSEEAVIKGIESVVGKEVPIMGGSCADNTIEGKWKLFAGDQVYNSGAVVTAIFTTLKIGVAFRSGCVPTEKSGVVTKVEGRRIFEIDNQPAGKMYNDWTEGLISDYFKEGGSILQGTTLSPLGRTSGKVADVDFYLLSHPAAVGKDGSYLDLFTEVKEGEKVYLMTGTKSALIQRAGAVTKSTGYRGDFENIAAAIVIYCAGCMLTVTDQMSSVVESINESIGEGVYIGGFTFGEQGCFPDQVNRHGNLMISVVAFSDEEV